MKIQINNENIEKIVLKLITIFVLIFAISSFFDVPQRKNTNILLKPNGLGTMNIIGKLSKWR